VTSIHPSIYDIVPSVAGTIYNRYKKYVERDDVKQECLIWAMARADYINEQLSEPNTEQRRHNEQKIAWQMSRVAERYARKEKAVKSGYAVADEAYYEQATLGQLLPFVIASVLDGTVLEQAQEMIRDGMPKGSSTPAEGGNLLSMLIDIKKAFVQLSKEDQKNLIMRYHENFTLTQIAQVLECSRSSADRRCMHSLRELTNLLGGASPYR